MSAGYLNLVGPGRDALLQRDAALRSLLPLRSPDSPEYRKALEAFRNSPLSGCTTVLDLCRKKAGYKPMSGDSSAVARFAAAIGTHPLFRAKPPPSVDFDVVVGDVFGQVSMAEVIARYRGTDAEAVRRIDQQLQQVMSAAVASHGGFVTNDLLMEHSLAADNGGAITFYMGRSTARAAFAMLPHGTFIMRVAGTKTESIWEFDSSAWPAQAEAVMKEQITLVPDWIDQNDT